MTTSPALCPERAAAQRAVLARVAAVDADEARVFAAKMRVRAELDTLWNGGRGLDEGPQVNGYFGVIELAGTARIGQARAATQLQTGTRLVTVLTRTLAGLEAGEVYVETARLLLELTRNCTEQVATEVERRVLDQIRGICTTDARRLIEHTIPEVEADLDPELTDQRLDLAAQGAHTWTRDLPDGMAQIGCETDLLSARRWSADFDQLVRAQVLADQREGVKRSMNQVRAAVFTQLPSRLLALVTAIQRGNIDQLMALARIDPALADEIETLAASAGGLDAADVADAAEAADAADPAAADDGPNPPGDEPSAHWLNRIDCSPLDPQLDLGAELCPEPPDLAPEPETEPDPFLPDRAPAWTDLSVTELVVQVLRQKLHDPQILNIHLPVSTALELDNRVATLDGGGVLPARHARLLLPTATLRRVFVDPDSYLPIGLDPTLHPPPTAADPQAELNHKAESETTVASRQRRKRSRANKEAPTTPQQQREQLRAQIRDVFGPDALNDVALVRDVVTDFVGDLDRDLDLEVNVKAGQLASGENGRPPPTALARLRPLMEAYLLDQHAEPAHDPSAALRAFVNLRDQRCTGIGCSHPAGRSHLDHLIPWSAPPSTPEPSTAEPSTAEPSTAEPSTTEPIAAEPSTAGVTAAWNLGAKSARCHLAKHAGWTVTQPLTGPDSSSITWTSPLGHSYTGPTRWTRIPPAH